VALILTSCSSLVPFLPSSDSLSAPLISLFQDRFLSCALNAATLFLTSSRSAKSMLDELVATWHRGAVPDEEDRGGEQGSDEDEDEADAEESMATPRVFSRAFHRSVLSASFPRILLLAPGMNHRFNEQLHRHLLALDANANLQVNQHQTHTFVSRKTASGDGASESAAAETAASTAAAAASSAAPSTLSPRSSLPSAPLAAPSAPPVVPPPPTPEFLRNDPQVPFDSSVFSVPLSHPALLEYVLYRSVSAGVWPDLSRLQRALESRIADSPSGTLGGPTYPSPLEHDLNDVFVARHSRVFTKHGAHTLRRVVLLPGEVVLPDAEMIRATEAAHASTSDAVASAAAAAALNQHAQLEARNVQRLRDLFEPLANLRALSAWGGPRTVVFDDSAAGRSTAVLLAQLFPSLAFHPTYHSLLSNMSVYETICHAPNGASFIIVGSVGDLAPLASLLLHDGRKNHVILSKHDLRAAFQRDQVLEIEHCYPELPTSLMYTHIIPQTTTEKLKFQASRILNSQYVKLSSLKS
jgi:hypothetical protein